MSRHTHVTLSEEEEAGDKKLFKIDVAIERVEAAVQPYPKAALFELAEEGYRSAFELLVACVISVRTLDEMTLPTAREQQLPRRCRLEINRLLVPLGKHICTGRLPHCSTCPVPGMCRPVGVTRHR